MAQLIFLVHAVSQRATQSDHAQSPQVIREKQEHHGDAPSSLMARVSCLLTHAWQYISKYAIGSHLKRMSNTCFSKVKKDVKILE